MPIDAIRRIERRQVQFLDGRKHRPHQMSLRHPIAHRRRHQEHLITINPNKPRAHSHKAPDRTGRNQGLPDSLKNEQ
jgi:hypothetical protein